MASSYPGGLDSFATNHADGVQEVIHASSINDADDAINKIEAELGTAPRGVYTDVKTRLNTMERVVFNFVSALTYTLVLADTSRCVSPTNGTSCAVTIPPSSSVAWLTGATILLRAGSTAGTITIAGGAGVSLESRGSLFSLAGPIAWATLVYLGTDQWDLFGDLA